MEYCSRCFKKLCRCGKVKVEIDYYIYPAIYELNRKGYRTTSCCSGHEDTEHLSTYISFTEELSEEINSELFQFDAYNYRGFHERRDSVRIKPEIAKKFKKKRTNKLALIQEINKALYEWAQRLPAKTSNNLEKIIFPASYFDREIICNEIIDVQKPWLLVTKPANNAIYIARDFLDEIDYEGELTEIVANRTGRIKRTLARNCTPNVMRNAIEFDVSGDYRCFLLGYEPYVTIEKIFVGESTWFLSFARTDIAIEYGEYEPSTIPDEFDDEYEDLVSNYRTKGTNNADKSKDAMESLFDEDDIEDFWSEHRDVTEIDLFTFLFNRMCRININTCVFFADNIIIIFSNSTDFSFLMTNDQSVVAFGKADYEYLELSREHVSHKEVFIYANGRLLLRKEVE